MKHFKLFLEAEGWRKRTPADLEKIRKALEKEKRTTVAGQLKKTHDPNAKKYKQEPTLKYWSKVGEEVVNEDGMGAGAVAAGPTNTSSGGAVASVGQPPGSKFGEPGVYLGKKKKSDPRMFKQFRRKAPKM